jgi:hypothetical protein
MLNTTLISTIAPYFVPYLELHGATGDFYYFRKESTSLRDSEGQKRVWHPRVRHTMLRSHHSPTEGILYAAFRKEVVLRQLQADDLLYIGCSSSGGSRYWRGRPNPTERYAQPKSIFHHEQMRRGRDGSNLESYLTQVGPVVLHTLTDDDVQKIIEEHKIALPDGKYPAHQLERAVLLQGYTNWKWNGRS